jgi:octanoyl-[GcvH]:protein N-octanoyltransferase
MAGSQPPCTPGEDVRVRLHAGGVDGADEALELAVAHALVRRASRGEVSEVLRVYRPERPVVVFGRRDTRLPGFGAAAGVASDTGFRPLVRATGGRAVAYTQEAIVVDHVRHDPHAAAGLDRRFEEYGARLALVFRDLGVDARVGAVPGEYCPGAQSVNARGTVKLVGTAQRVVRDAWLFSTLVVVGDEQRLRPLLGQIYGHLQLEFDEASVGSLTGEVPTLTVDTVERAVLDAWGAGDASPEALDPETLDLAEELVAQHRV